MSPSNDFISYPMLMDPVFSERPWGGKRLKKTLHKDVPVEGGPFGESWELSDHPVGRSRIANGPYAGRLFGEMVHAFPKGMCGVETAPQRYPLLVKYIDAAEDLSVQVHPDDAQAGEGDRGKTECWFIMDAPPDGEMIFGLRSDVDADALRRAARSGEMAECVQRVAVRPGDFVDIPAGTVHATLRGMLICEVQQSSNTTYRLWDWGRQPARELHIEDACRVAHYGESGEARHFHPEIEADGRWRRLVRNAFFEVRLAEFAPDARVACAPVNPHGLILNVVAGRGGLRVDDGPEPEALERGQTWYLPAGLEGWEVEVAPDEPEGLRLLLSESLELGA